MADDALLTAEERSMLAAELALGVLDGEERAQALRLQVSDPAFREAVIAWHVRLDPLFDGYVDVEAPDLWHAIERRLPTRADTAIGMIERRLTAWRRSALFAGAVAAGLVGVLLFRPAAAPLPVQPNVAQAGAPAIAHLGAADAAHQFAVNYDAVSGELRIRALRMPKSPLSPELWIIPADNVPRSLGIVSANGSTRVVVAPALRAFMIDGVTLAITLENREGAPHAAPSSAPVASGPINKI